MGIDMLTAGINSSEKLYSSLKEAWQSCCGEINQMVFPGQADYSQLEDSKLVSLTLSGQVKAYETLVRRYQKLVYNVLFQMMKNHETASDLTQETFLKSFRSLNTFRPDAKFKPWLLRIATNSGLNYIRDNKSADSLDEALEENPQVEPASKQNVELEVERTFTQALLNEAIGELTPRHRHFFILRYQHDLSYEDISVATGEPISTLKALLFRIRERLKKILTEKMRESVN